MMRSIGSVILALLILILISITQTVQAEEIDNYTTKNWHIWRWYELVQVDKDGRVDVWVKITFEFLNSTSDHPFYVDLKLPEGIRNFQIFPEEGTVEGSFLNHTISNRILKIKLKPPVVKIYRFYDVALHYTLEDEDVLSKKSNFWESLNKWSLDLTINIDDLIPEYIKEWAKSQPINERRIEYEVIKIFIILPDDASIHLSEPPFKLLTLKRFLTPTNFEKFEEIEYVNWSSGNPVASYTLPITTPKKGQFMKYTALTSPRDIHLEYVTPNDWVGFLSFLAVILGIFSSLYVIVKEVILKILRKLRKILRIL